MARSIVLGNSGLTVGLDEHGLVLTIFTTPYVGLENLTTARMQPHHVGIWVDGVSLAGLMMGAGKALLTLRIQN